MTTVSYGIVNVKPEYDGSINSSIFLGSEMTPALTTFDDGSFALAYGYEPAATEVIKNAVFIDRYNPDGSQAMAIGVYGASEFSTSSYAFYPSIANLPGTNRYLAVWTSSTGLNGGTMFGISKPLGTPDGVGYNKIFSQQAVLPGSTIYDSISHLAMLPNNKFAVLVNSGSSTAGVRIFAYDGAFNVSPVTQWQLGDGSGGLGETSANLAVLDGGNLAITYVQSQGGAYSAVVEIDTASGARILAPTTLNSLGSTRSPAIVALKDGGFAVAYLQSGGGASNDLRLAFYSSTGALRGNQLVASVSVFTDTDPTFTVLSNGFVDLTWTSGINTPGVNYYSNISAAMFDPATMTKVAAADLETQDGAQFEPAVTALLGGQFATAWTDWNTDAADGNVDTHGSHVSLQIDALTRTSVGTSAGDTLTGDSLRDVFTGGGGNDTFAFGAGGSTDIITDFVHGQDRIYLANFFSLHSFTDVLNHIFSGPTAVLSLGPDSLTLTNVNKTSLTADDFILARQKADFDGNNRSDVVLLGDNGVATVWDNGAPASAHQIAPAGTISGGWHFGGTGDFDGNGQSDILWVNDSTGQASIWDNGQIGGAHIIAPAGTIAGGWHFAGTGDFDGNSRTDILWVNDGTGQASIWDNGQIGGAHIIAPAGTIAGGWHFGGTGDFDGNGRSDIAWVNDNGKISIWDNGQIGGAHIVANLGSDISGWHLAGTGDFDGNGKSDLLWVNDNGRASIWDNGDVARAHTIAPAGTIANGWQFAGTGDYDGNGHSDILWQNSNGQASIWDNGSIAKAHIIAAAGSVPAGWDIV
ncbi:hypothetical protein JQ633_18955 [Bradyrhizobium tropiciagri]|uniref:FG-GAP repeat domain-containing protein n=1 Tax=Bradyrhizobium tropiciagri TaxID=312253 RepID=UPI001BA94CDC|nr:VCBS repeat-containing protein [Bradyrhizobium tropiciagri]MBR0872447.1 hypothetical protein [Bradyrhizobium tropiciagri]